ncbi:MAG TPA: hypothetical protein VIM23_09535 [Gaiellaceae bacterium]
MAPPVEHLGQQHAGHKRGADDDQRRRAFRAALALLLRARPELWARGSARLLVHRSPAAGARLDQARLQLAQERGVVGELPGQPLPDAVAAGRGLVGELLQTLGAPLDCVIGLGHFFAGGASPVATRQIFEAALRAAIVAPAARPA